MAEDADRGVSFKGTWKWSRELAFLLGLCPLLAVTTSAVNGLALGIATLLTLVIASACMFAIGGRTHPQVKLAAFALVVASLVCALELVINAYLHGVYNALGVYLPLTAASCVIMACAGNPGFPRKLIETPLDALAMGAAVTAVLVILGGLRELLGQGLLLTALAPGGFIGLGLLIALKNHVVNSSEWLTK